MAQKTLTEIFIFYIDIFFEGVELKNNHPTILLQCYTFKRATQVTDNILVSVCFSL